MTDQFCINCAYSSQTLDNIQDNEITSEHYKEIMYLQETTCYLKFPKWIEKVSTCRTVSFQDTCSFFKQHSLRK